MNDLLSPTDNTHHKLTRRRERRMACLEAPGKTGSVAHAAAWEAALAVEHRSVPGPDRTRAQGMGGFRFTPGFSGHEMHPVTERKHRKNKDLSPVPADSRPPPVR